ncbi:hypothetical protein PHMEG_00032721 [Phytophthora megakarya]|uniref:Uncharacterized protein n=1 Tax=Phytophthora megakarya TaxID=4795 RepID=A0A225UV29_9STRA|nr:hypothetical protein PHMEG_00032721 [Phytophthora megakarya]
MTSYGHPFSPICFASKHIELDEAQGNARADHLKLHSSSLLASHRSLTAKLVLPDSNAYIYTLPEFLLPASRHRFGIKLTFQHENASIHSLKLTKMFLDESLE